MQTGEMQRGFEAQTRQMRIDLEHERAQKRSARYCALAASDTVCRRSLCVLCGAGVG
jgi:hypothetical protein